MGNKKSLKANELKQIVDPRTLNYDPLNTVADTTDLIYGQERGIKAFDFGLDIDLKGYNIYFEGPTGVGKTMYIKKYLAEKAIGKETPGDWCYVYNFNNPNEPIAIYLPAGEGREFKKMMEDFIPVVKKYLQNGFKDENQEKQKQEIEEKFQMEKKDILDRLNSETKPKGFEIVESSNGVFMLPVIKGRTLSKEQFEKLDSKTKIEFESKSTEIQDQIFETLTILKESEMKKDEKISKWKQEIAEILVSKAIIPLIERFKENKRILQFIASVKNDILKNLDEFLKKDLGQKSENPMMQAAKKPWDNYGINLFVDNSETRGAPVIMDINYTFENIFGKIEYENKLGTLITDYKKIKPGLIHKANGGYIVFQARELLATPMAYDILKRALKIERIGLEEGPEQKIPMILVTLKPESIPIKVKVIIIGHSDIYDMLLQNDPDFKKLFKIKVEFEETAERSEENQEKLMKFIASYTIQENLLPLNNEALARIIEYASALADQKDKFSTNFAEIGKLVAESSTWAKEAGSNVITEEYVNKAKRERINRIKKYDNKLTELIEKDKLLIETTGKKVGQINGLSVISLGDYSFGKPNKITANTYMGNRGVVNIEREIKMSGPSHSKGVLILIGYLGQKFAQNFPLNMSAYLCFEQLYGEVDGDSASSTELYAILSSLSDLPINQEIAVTGSVNQKGIIQPIGGVNEKILGFYQICKLRGLTGTQGVIIPKQNVENLHLDDEVIEAVDRGKFNIYAISTIDEGIEILTGVPSGKMNEDGEYPRGTVNHLVYEKLKKYNTKGIEKNTDK